MSRVSQTNGQEYQFSTPHANDLIEEEVYSGNNDLPAFGSDGIPIQSNPGFGTESPLPYSPSTTRYGSPTTNTATTTASGTANPSNASAASSLRSSVNALVSLLAAFGIAMWLFRTN
ncbi:hypothetical protein BX666DRAFT_2022741 [Dichotomocladium elegans]|nr:hypothetical protein BX666DRAFT_2022741 [Dichotomocladium elegans]